MTDFASLPPPVTQYFGRYLLESAIPLADNCAALWAMFLHIGRMAKKCNTPERAARWLALEQQWFDLYGIALAKEEDVKTKTGHLCKGPLYFIQLPDCRYEGVYQRLRKASYRHRTKRKDDSI